MKKLLCILLIAISASELTAQKITGEDFKFIEQNADKLLKGSIIVSKDGVNLYTPDGKANYAALWTRDFAYMVQNAGYLIPKNDILRCIEHLIGGIRVDGAAPDRVQPDGIAVYSGGGISSPLGKPNLDNAPFLIFTVYDYLTKYSGLNPTEQSTLFKKWENILLKSINYLPLSADGLIYNDPENPHSPYGFTDTVKKGGKLLKESLLYWEACKKMYTLYSAAGMKSEAAQCKTRYTAVEKSISELWSSENGMFLAATQNCRQVDIWGNIYALYIDFPMSKLQEKTITENLTKNYDRYVKWGQVRHLYRGEYWESLLGGVPENRYQNGAYWATPSGWLIEVLYKSSPELAERTARDILSHFKNNGIFECVYDDYTQLDSYVASATNILPAIKKLSTK